MIGLNPQLAASDSSGIPALGINLKSFIFQLITFLIVLLILRRWVFPKLVETLEARRKTLEESLTQAKQTEEALARAEQKAADILHKARQQADAALADAKEQAKATIAQAEADAEAKASRIIKDSQARIDQEREKLRGDLKSELVGLVTAATQRVLRTKLTPKEDLQLIEKSVKEISR